jgi:hypothetical protein
MCHPSGSIPGPNTSGRGRAEAHEMLAPVYDWFSERFNPPVLKEAKALLEALN